MKITKFGHSCVLLDDGTTKILFDPGNWAEIPDIKVDAIIITHNHGDHIDMPKVKALLAGNPEARIITNTQVKEELDKEGIACEIVEQGGHATIGGFSLKAFGNDHAIIHPTMPTAQNTGYLVNEKIYHPGDSLFVPEAQIEFLFLPVVAPWSKIEETLDYIEAIKPKTALPIHDAFLRPEAQTGLFYRLSKMWIDKVGAQLIEPELGKEYEISI